jgi:FMN phosphatase YigB (HAD superfamily)
MIKAFVFDIMGVVVDPQEDLIPDIEVYLLKIKKAGYGLHAMSNLSLRHWLQLKSKHEKIFSLFDTKTLSGEVGFSKPSREIFHHFLDNSGLEAEECLFIDDSSANCDGAAQCGFKTIYFKGESNLFAHELQNLGLLNEKGEIRPLGLPPHP